MRVAQDASRLPVRPVLPPDYREVGQARAVATGELEESMIGASHRAKAGNGKDLEASFDPLAPEVSKGVPGGGRHHIIAGENRCSLVVVELDIFGEKGLVPRQLPDVRAAIEGIEQHIVQSGERVVQGFMIFRDDGVAGKQQKGSHS
jgi:hypothetical protein